jgi:hypothetical protein
MFNASLKKISLPLVLAVSVFLSSCSTDFDINAEWEDIAVVYALLDYSDSAQYVKLNKVFLGDMSAYEMAQIKDSIYYDQASVSLLPIINGNPQSSQAINLFLSDEIDKDSGVFYYDQNLIYKTTQVLQSNMAYQLFIDIPGKDPVTSTTVLIDELSVTSPSSGAQVKVSFANFFGYTDFTAEAGLNPDGLMYGLTLRIKYLEFYADSTVQRSINWKQSNKTKEYLVGSQQNFLTWPMRGEDFYFFINQHIKADPLVQYRKFESIDFVFSLAGPELVKYLETSGPSQGIIQDRPFYTNISNGIGLFSSRYTKVIADKKITDFSLDNLACDDKTRHLLFMNSTGEVNACD